MTECIDHGRHGDKQRYASCWFQGRYMDQHVRALILRTGEQPNGRVARHLCGNKRCINGGHLEWGTQADNIRDTIGQPGSKATSGKVLTDQECAMVHKYRSMGWLHREIAEHMGVSRVTITQILSGARRKCRM